jgi:hypothetical protein
MQHFIHTVKHKLHDLAHRYEAYVHVSYCAAVFGEQTFGLHIGLYPMLAGLMAVVIIIAGKGVD